MYCVNICTPPFQLDLSSKRFLVCFTKSFLFLSTAHVFHIAQKSKNLNNQFRCGRRDNSDHENVSEELFGCPF